MMKKIRAGAQLVVLEEFSVERGHCRIAPIPEEFSGNQRGAAPSGCRLFEDGIEIGPGGSLHDDIRRLGGGRFSHWGSSLYFSSSDGTPPEANGRTYQALIPAAAAGPNALLAHLATSDFEAMSTDSRYSAVEHVMAELIPGVHLPEIARSMFCDDDFRRDYERFSIENYRSYDRKFAMRELARLALKQEGDFAECGVFKGASAYILAKELAAQKSERKLHLYDSFEGLSSPTSVDGNHWTRGDLLGRLVEVQSNLKDFAAGIAYHKGWIPECFDETSHGRFCFVHIDVDLHQPTAGALAYFYPRMSQHGVILCDDYGFETCPGARKAVDDFFRGKKETVLHLPTGQGVIVCNL